MDDFLQHRFPNFFQLTAGTTIDVALRYFLFCGIAWVFAYVFFKQRWLHRKIVSKFPQSSEVRREIGYSILSLLIFGLTAAATMTAAKHGWTQLYWRIADHGWGWFWMSINNYQTVLDYVPSIAINIITICSKNKYCSPEPQSDGR